MLGLELHFRIWVAIVMNKDGIDLLHKRYGLDSKIDVSEWFSRIVDEVTKNYTCSKTRMIQQVIYKDILSKGIFFPTTAALVNVLNKRGGLAGCAVLPLEADLDLLMEKSLPEILKMLREGIGIGIDLSVLKPRLSTCMAVEDRASVGCVETLKSIVSCAEPLMKYGGLKRAAFMASLNFHHPDIFEFISCKINHPQLTGVNISVSVDADFKNCLKNKNLMKSHYYIKNNKVVLTVDQLTLMHQMANKRFVSSPDLSIENKNEIFSRSANRTVGKVIHGEICFDSEIILDFVADCAHKCGDPGVLDMEVINKYNPTYYHHDTQNLELGRGAISVTTPCGEQPLLPYEVCYLGSLSLKQFIKRNSFDFDGIKEATYNAVYFMDDLIEISDNRHELMNRVSLSNRKIGIGIMGLADSLAGVRLPYGSEEARKFARKVMSTIKNEAIRASEKLAQERGAFPNWPYSTIAQSGLPPRRHATLTTIAPTGHISRLANCSSSIEPYYMVQYQQHAGGVRNITIDSLEKELDRLNYSLKRWIEDSTKKNFTFDGKTLRSLYGSPTANNILNRELQELQLIYQTSFDVSALDHLRMLYSLQDYIDNGISKTINLPNNATISEVKEIIIEALNMGLKGITIFRDQCLSNGVQALSALDSKSVTYDCDSDSCTIMVL
jgi:ribonucleoside-diphosphate reductase alpha chain